MTRHFREFYTYVSSTPATQNSTFFVVKIMRTLFILSQVSAMLGSAVPPSDMVMLMFVSCECLNPTAETTDLYRVFDTDKRTVYALFDWYKLDEATFIRLARKPATSAHKDILEKPVGVPLAEYMQSLRAQGMSDDQVTTELLKKYYKSLRSKTVMAEIEMEDAEYED
jgi:hypothetical protein